MDEKELECLKHEYTEVHQYIRLHSTLRFAIFTVFFAALGGLTSISFGIVNSQTRNPKHIELGGRIAALFLTWLFYRYEIRIQSLIDHGIEYGRELEKKLGYKFILSRPPFGKWRTHKINRLAFQILGTFWLVMIVWVLVEILFG